MSRINTANLRDCVERDMWYQSALGRLTQRGTGQDDPDEGAEDPPTPQTLEISSYYVKTS